MSYFEEIEIEFKKIAFGETSENYCTSNLTKVELINLCKMMIKIRIIEFFIAGKRQEKIIGGPVHLSVGQEAIPVGISHFLTKKDKVFSAHRSHAHILALGTTVDRLFSELLGKKNGLSHGMGGSMHLIDLSNGFYGSTPIVGGTVPVAVGAAWASLMKNESSVAVSYLGDGAMEEGVVHESMNLAKIYNIPILFVIENNLFASHMHIKQRQPMYSTARFAAANLIPFKIVDGNNILSVTNIAQKFLSEMRNNGGPRFIEAITYRWLGHVDWREDIDVGVSRSVEDLQKWKDKDPIKRIMEYLRVNFEVDLEYFKKYEKINREKLLSDWDAAEKDVFPEKDEIENLVFRRKF